MATRNPFADDDNKGDVWEQGYLAGFAEPETDHFRPFSEELAEAYRQGEQSGRDDRRRQPPDSGEPSEESEGHSWVKDVAEEGVEHGLLHAIGMGCEKIFGEIGGLVPVIITVLTIPGDVQLHPLEPEWSGPSDEQEGNTFVAVCPRTDHPMVVEGVMSDGYWAGPGHTDFGDAEADVQKHGHAEAFVARCSLPDGTCGPVYPMQ